MCPRKEKELPRKTIWLDKKGRIVIPEYLRKALGLEVPGWVVIERFPIEGECKTLFIKRDGQGG